MSKKIGKVIDDCNNCDHLRKTQEIGGNTYFAAICQYPKNKEFLVRGFNKHPGHYTINIADECPLEDYQGSRPIIEHEGDEDE